MPSWKAKPSDMASIRKTRMTARWGDHMQTEILRRLTGCRLEVATNLIGTAGTRRTVVGATQLETMYTGTVQCVSENLLTAVMVHRTEVTATRLDAKSVSQVGAIHSEMSEQ